MVGPGLFVEPSYSSAHHLRQLSIPLSLRLLVTPVHALHVFHVYIRLVLLLMISSLCILPRTMICLKYFSTITSVLLVPCDALFCVYYIYVAP
ncbi:hypothetical protein EDD22DRAFT_94737 [Suillus occidentalis]|nr:hypothetical protein EDD22DRAFT_94737 [Suillus occidentalis]